MSEDSEIKRRLERLREQRQARASQDPASRGQSGLRARMMAAAAEKAPVVAAESEENPLPAGLDAVLPGGRGAIVQLLKNPDIRHALLQWLQNQENNAAQPVGGENAWGLEFGETPPYAEELTTSSTPEEISRYDQQLRNRADWLEAALAEILLEMKRVSRFKPAVSESGLLQESPADPLL
jgi:hypothetical protein